MAAHSIIELDHQSIELGDHTQSTPGAAPTRLPLD